MQVLSAELQGNAVLGVWSEAAARPKLNRAASYVLATGGVLGGGFTVTTDGSLRESIFNLPLAGYLSENGAFRRSFLGSGGQPLHRLGIQVNRELQPLDSQGSRLYQNLYAVGTALADADPIQERSLEGIALVTGFAAGRRVVSR